MGKHTKTLERMRHHPYDWRINDLLALARHYGISVRNNGGSHYVFAYPDIDEALSIPAHRPIKPVYVRHFVAWVARIEELRDE